MTHSTFHWLKGMRVVVTAMLLIFGQMIEAQQTKMIPRIGYLAPVFPCTGPISSLEAFQQGLHELGYSEGRNITIECRSAEGKSDRLPGLAAELARIKVDIIVAAGGELVARAARQASRTIPIIMTNASDPVATGLVSSLARPGGNVTGLVSISTELSAKRLEVLKQAFPNVSRVAVLTNPANPEQVPRMREVKAAAQALGVQLKVLEVRSANDFENAFSMINNSHSDALLTLGDPLIVSQQSQIVEFAAQNRMPAIYHRTEFVDAGGLMSYGPNYNELFRNAAKYVDRILKGAKPGDLPIERPTKFDLVINLKTAKALGLTIPQSVLLRATVIIE